MARTRLNHTDTHRTCYRCRQLKANAEFTWRANGTPFSACKACNVEMARERRAARACVCGHTEAAHFAGSCHRLSGRVDAEGRGLPCDCKRFTKKGAK